MNELMVIGLVVGFFVTCFGLMLYRYDRSFYRNFKELYNNNQTFRIKYRVWLKDHQNGYPDKLDEPTRELLKMIETKGEMK